MPEGYVKNQYDQNKLHTNEAVEVWSETATHFVQALYELCHRHHVELTSFLDIGCRTGYAMDMMLDLWPSAHVEGIDLIPEFIKLADDAAPARVMDMHKLEFDDEQFDCTFSCQTLEHAYDVPTALNEQFRVTKRLAFISVPCEGQDWFDRNASHYRYSQSTFAWLDHICADRGLHWDVFYIDRYKGYLNTFFIRKPQ